MKKHRINISIQIDLTGYALKNENNLVSKLRKLGIIVQKREESSKFFVFYTEEGIPNEQYAVAITKQDIKNKYWINGFKKKKNIEIITLDFFYKKIKDSIIYSPYGMYFGLNDIENWKSLNIEDIEDIEEEDLIEEYQKFRIEKNSEDKEKIKRIIHSISQK